jgi:hypothetical protein
MTSHALPAHQRAAHPHIVMHHGEVCRDSMSFTHLETVPGGNRIAPDAPVNAPPGALLYPRYDLERIAGNVTPADIARCRGSW